MYRKLEARGEIRGGRFASAFSVSVSGADSLNLAGILTPGPKLPALAGNRVLYRDGLPLALFTAGEVQYLDALEGASEWEARNALLRSAKHAAQALRGAA